jgi:hypothetical protein
MKTNKDKPISWINGVRQNLQVNTPAGWIILEDIKGAGVQMLPDDCIYSHHNSSKEDYDLVGAFKIIFEFFRLDRSGNVKISARINGIEGQPLFHEFNGIARGLGCPEPRDNKKKTSQSVAAWPAEKERKSFKKDDHSGMANWVRVFLCQPPADFTLFVALSRNLLAKFGT